MSIQPGDLVKRVDGDDLMIVTHVNGERCDVLGLDGVVRTVDVAELRPA